MTSIHKTEDQSDFRFCFSRANTVLLEERGDRMGR